MPRYEVGPRPFLGHAPGETFSAQLPEDQEHRAITRGSIRRLATTPIQPVRAVPSDDKSKDVKHG